MSGLSRTPGKRVRVNSPPRVRIPPSPPVSQQKSAHRALFCFYPPITHHQASVYEPAVEGPCAATRCCPNLPSTGMVRGFVMSSSASALLLRRQSQCCFLTKPRPHGSRTSRFVRWDSGLPIRCDLLVRSLLPVSCERSHMTYP